MISFFQCIDQDKLLLTKKAYGSAMTPFWSQQKANISLQHLQQQITIKQPPESFNLAIIYSIFTISLFTDLY